MSRAVFLDRDGVINKLVHRPGKGLKSPAAFKELELLPRVTEAVEILKKVGFKVVVVSNQPDLSRGIIKRKELDKMTEKLKEIGIDEAYYCPHTAEENCTCRKPKPNLLIKACDDLNIDLEKSYMIGDKMTDIQAGKLCKKTFLISDGGRHISKDNIKPGFIVSSLYDAAKIIKELEGF